MLSGRSDRANSGGFAHNCIPGCHLPRHSVLRGPRRHGERQVMVSAAAAPRPQRSERWLPAWTARRAATGRAPGLRGAAAPSGAAAMRWVSPPPRAPARTGRAHVLPGSTSGGNPGQPRPTPSPRAPTRTPPATCRTRPTATCTQRCSGNSRPDRCALPFSLFAERHALSSSLPQSVRSGLPI